MCFEFLIRIAGRGRKQLLCGGSLIHENFVLTGLFVFGVTIDANVYFNDEQCCFFSFSTAAHCINGRAITVNQHSLETVRLGENDLRSLIDCEEVREKDR